MAVLTVYRPIIDGLDEVSFFAKRVAEDLEIDGSDDAHVQWGNSPRAIALMVTGELARYMSRSPFVPQISRFVNRSGLSATAELWGTNLGYEPCNSTHTEKRMISLRHNLGDNSPDELCFTPDGFDEIAIAALESANEIGISVKQSIWNRAQDVSTFHPFPLLDGSGVRRDDFSEYRKSLDYSELPVLQFGPLTVAFSDKPMSDSMWSNYGIIPRLQS